MNGEGHCGAKLNAALVAEIRHLYRDSGLTQRGLAAKYQVSHSAVWSIVNNRTWKFATNDMDDARQA